MESKKPRPKNLLAISILGFVDSVLFFHILIIHFAY